MKDFFFSFYACLVELRVHQNLFIRPKTCNLRRGEGKPNSKYINVIQLKKILGGYFILPETFYLKKLQ